MTQAIQLPDGLIEEFIDDRPTTYRVGVVVAGEKSLTYNGLTFETWDEAQAYANDLAARWTAVIATRVEEVAA